MASRIHVNAVAMAAAVFLGLLWSPAAAQNPLKMQEPPTPETHSAKMSRIIADPEIDTNPSRLDGDLRALDAVVIITRHHLSSLDAYLAMASSPAIEAEKAAYTSLLSDLKDAKTALAEIQVTIEQCQLKCATAELNAAKGQPVPENHFAIMRRNVTDLRNHVATLDRNLKEISSASNALEQDPNLQRLVSRLTEAEKAVNQVVALCAGTAGTEKVEKETTGKADPVEDMSVQ